MKVKELAIIILMIIILVILNVKVEATTGKINSETVRLRKEADTKSTIIEQLDKDAEVEIIEEENEWYKVKTKINGETLTGYISKKLVDVKEETTPTEITEPIKNEEIIPEPTTKTIETNVEIKENEQYELQQETDIKAIPSIISKTKTKISGNIKIIEIINEWCRIENDTEIGWVRKNTLKTSIQVKTESEEPETVQQPEEEQQPQTTTTQTETPKEEKTDKTQDVKAISKIGYVSADGLIVRKEPTTSSEEIDSLSKNDKLEIIGETNGWYQIKLNTKTGYVSAKYVSDTKIVETTSRSGSTIKSEEVTPMEVEISEPEEEESKTSTGKGNEVVEYAKKYLNYKYVAGGSSPETGFDCSGFTTYVFKHFGISLSRSSKAQIYNGVAVEKSDLQPGDIVVFNNNANTSIGHVGIYIGENKFIHAANSREGVVITSLASSYYSKRYVGARRVI